VFDSRPQYFKLSRGDVGLLAMGQTGMQLQVHSSLTKSSYLHLCLLYVHQKKYIYIYFPFTEQNN